MSEKYSNADTDTGEFPPQWGFVVQLSRPDSAVDASVCGRIEHIQSGRHSRFESQAQMVEFLLELQQDRSV